MKPTTPVLPSSSAVPESNVSIAPKGTDTAEFQVEDKQPGKQSVKPAKPPAKIPKSYSDAEYAEIFDAVLRRFGPIEEEEKVDEDVEEETEGPLVVLGQVVIKEEPVDKDPFDEIIEDGKAIDELCKFDDNDDDDDEKMEVQDVKEEEEKDEEDEQEEECDEENAEQLEDSRHQNENTPITSDNEALNHDESSNSSNPPSIPKKKIFKAKPKKSKFTPKKLSYPFSKKNKKTSAGFKSTEKNAKRPETLFTYKDSSKEIKKKESRRDWMKTRDVELLGTWVQCSDVTCHKWRYLPHIQDPSELPEYWTCSLNTDPLFDSCDKPEQEYEKDEHVYTKYTEGSIVWANMTGYPWWPAMVEVDPDYEMFAESRYNSTEVSHYHVVFFDDRVTRAWIAADQLRPFNKFRESCGAAKTKGHNYKKEINIARQKASYAIGLSIKERLEEFSFARRYNGKWGKTGDQDHTEKQKVTGRNSKKGHKRMRTSTPRDSQCSDLADVSLNSDLAEFQDLENAIDAILDNDNGCGPNSFNDEVFSNCQDEEYNPESPRKPKKKKNVADSDEVKKPKKEKLDKKEKIEKAEKAQKKEKKERKSKDGDQTKEKKEKTEKSSKAANQPSAPKVKPVFAVPKGKSTSSKSDKTAKSDISKTTKKAKSFVEEHLNEEQSENSVPPKKKAIKPKSVLSLSQEKDDGHDDDDDDMSEESDTQNDKEVVNNFDPDIFTMEMETQDVNKENVEENEPQVANVEEGNENVKKVDEVGKKVGKKAVKTPKKKQTESETEVEGQPKPKKVMKAKKESEGAENESETKVKGQPKKKVETESETTNDDGEPKAKKKKSDAEVENDKSEAATITAKKRKTPVKKVAISENTETRNSTENVESESVNVTEEMSEKSEEKKKPKAKRARTSNKQSLAPTEDVEKETSVEVQKKKFAAPIAKPKKPGFQAPVSKKENKAPKSAEKEVKDQKESVENDNEQTKGGVIATPQKTPQKTPLKTPKGKKGGGNAKKSDCKKTPKVQKAVKKILQTPEKNGEEEIQPSASDDAKNATEKTEMTKTTKAQTTTECDDDDDDDGMMLDLEVNQEATTDSAMQNVAVEDQAAMPNSQASAGSGYESDLFESEM